MRSLPDTFDQMTNGQIVMAIQECNWELWRTGTDPATRAAARHDRQMLAWELNARGTRAAKLREELDEYQRAWFWSATLNALFVLYFAAYILGRYMG